MYKDDWKYKSLYVSKRYVYKPSLIDRNGWLKKVSKIKTQKYKVILKAQYMWTKRKELDIIWSFENVATNISHKSQLMAVRNNT